MYSSEKQIYTSVLIASIVLAIIIGYYVYSVLKNSKRWNKEREKLLLQEINNIENERATIAKNIHDSLGAELSLIKFQLDDLSLVAKEDDIKVGEIKKDIDKIISDARAISHNLIPSGLLKKGLIDAIDKMATKLKNTLAIELNVNNYSGFDYNTEIHIFRILEEVIHNTIKYANASLLKIDFRIIQNELQIITRDNGVGFSFAISEVNFSTLGLGLNNIKFRAELIGGKASFFSEKNKGVEIRLKIPVVNK